MTVDADTADGLRRANLLQAGINSVMGLLRIGPSLQLSAPKPNRPASAAGS